MDHEKSRTPGTDDGPVGQVLTFSYSNKVDMYVLALPIMQMMVFLSETVTSDNLILLRTYIVIWDQKSWTQN